MSLPKEYVSYPVVYPIEEEYQICVHLEKESLAWITVGGQKFADHFAGVLRSKGLIRKFTVPKALMDRERAYTLHIRQVIDRTPYFPKSEDTVSVEFKFRPLPTGEVRFFCASDVHSKPARGLMACAGADQPIDGLMLLGDIPDSCNSANGAYNLLELAGTVTKGEIPTFFARGNHDCRGAFAEEFGCCSPHKEGRTYFTFRAGDLWCLVLDCGEDKPDELENYGSTICFHDFRLEETAFLKEVAAKGEYKDPAIKHRLVLCHHPFTHQLEAPFDIELDIYGEWAKLLREEIKPTGMICGHIHTAKVYLPGGELDQLGQPCPIVTVGKPGKNKETEELTYIGAQLTIGNRGCEVQFINEKQEILSKESLATF